MKQQCINCGKEINTDKDKYVMVETGDGSTILDQSYFHFNCWIEYFKSRVSNKINAMKDNAIGMLSNAMDKIKNDRINN